MIKPGVDDLMTEAGIECRSPFGSLEKYYFQKTD